ncbi:fatty acid desaturase [Hymenobacter norwichensis]|uniref:fatty acid desaturase n=1 Tax=Hymenobacter norwichensis TaxID=223903 RepID=UPI0003B78515|nr:fatty acid desaturase [Hymenobacter norwichensis]
MASTANTFVLVETPEPHRVRTRQIVKAHPEVKELMTRTPATALIGVACVAAQVLLAVFLRHEPWYIIALAAYFVGAFFSHTLFVVIHEAAHNLVFRKVWQNVAVGIVANFASVVPTAVSFKNFHIKHHVFQGVHELDADLPDWYEAKLIKNYSLGKAVWLFFFPLFQVVRTIRCREVAVFDRYVVANIVAQLAFDAAIVYFFGWPALGYLFLSFWFSVGLHPLGARWIQEHYLTLDDRQETYSYYGPLNGINLNVGYHNEHHDMPSIPWNKLPRLKAVAPEFYEPLLHHRSYTKLFFTFLFDQEISLFSRITRRSRGHATLQDRSIPDKQLVEGASA